MRSSDRPAGAPLSIDGALAEAGLAVQSLACLLAADSDMARPELHAAASALNVPLRFAAASDDVAQWLSDTLDQIGRAHVCTPVHNAHLVCRLLLDKKKKNKPLNT